MWQFNASALHPLRDTKNTIANHVMNGTAKVNGSIPSSTFKNGAFPRTMAVSNYNENAEPDTKPRDMTFSPLEFVGLMNMRYALPAGVEKNIRKHSYATGMGDAMVRKGKWKTSNATKIRNVPYPPTSRTGSNLQFLKGGRSNYGKNRAILATGPSDQFVISEFASGRRPLKHAFLNKEVLEAAINVLAKWADGAYESGTLSILTDLDVATIAGAAVDWASPDTLYRLSQRIGIPQSAIAATMRLIFKAINKAKNSYSAGKKTGEEGAGDGADAGADAGGG